MKIAPEVLRLLAPLRSRIANVAARAVVSLVDDEKKMQLLQLSVLDGETRDEVERLQSYGFTSVPLDGAEALLICVGGRREHAVAVAVDDRRHRLKGLKKGEVALYSKFGQTVVLKENGDVEVTPKAGADVVLAGGSKKVTRVGDAVRCGTLAAAYTGGTVELTYTAPDGTQTVGSSVTLAGESDAGADHVKA